MIHPQPKAHRFAAYARVSTDDQRDYGSSLPTQRSRIESAIEQLGGTIVARYGGSEHGTPGYERIEFDRMIADAESGKFDAICVADLQRWSRDTVASEQAVRRLRKCRVRLFVGTTEIDLRSPGMQIALTVATKSSETETSARIAASVYGRIEQAALGHASSGGQPFGRYVRASLSGTRRIWDLDPDGTAKWQVDPKAKRYVQTAVKYYLAGKTWRQVAKAMGERENVVRRRVTAAGGVWQQRFCLGDHRPEDFAGIRFFERLSFEGNYVTVTIPVPALVDEATLDRVRAKAADHHADYKAPNKQVLGGYLRCANCSGSIGTHYHAKTGAVYLQHNGPGLPGCPVKFGRYEPLERSVLRQYGIMLRDPVELEAGVREALLEETTRQPELENRLRDAKANYAALFREHDDVYKKMKAFDLAEGGATMSKLAADLNRLDAQLKAAAEEIKELEEAKQVTRLPTDFAERVAFTLFCLRGYGTNSRWLLTWPAAQRREMIQFLFGQQSRKPPKRSKSTEEPTGVYLERKRDEATGKEVIAWVAKGWFPQVSDTVWFDPKVTAYHRPAADGKGIDRKRLVELVRRLDIGQFGFARSTFNAFKLACRRWSGSGSRGTTLRRRGPGSARPA